FYLGMLLLPPIFTRLPYTPLFRSPAGDLADGPGIDHRITTAGRAAPGGGPGAAGPGGAVGHGRSVDPVRAGRRRFDARVRTALRSEEHTSELQSRENLVCRLLLEK